ncbi:PKD domain-containing protein [Opitutus sp. ER46]|uniref:PKD domain-containing protein n=1 Tax=Opitutus sp. ER46 TaxID=2161864 RepID=UPI000D302207|nr:PKD domain-containing protein [Opitutus sp. ER46]PTX91420.1 PKD domain containing protein [Opitutus sp. ER46]
MISFLRPGRLSLAACVALLAGVGSTNLSALDRPDRTFQVFQFPRDRIPRVDGDASDWAMVPETYAIGLPEFVDDTGNHATQDPANLAVKVRVGWVAGLNRLYFLYEATDNCLDFADPTLNCDTFEVIVDGDASGGPLLDVTHKEIATPRHVGEASVALDPRIGPAEAHWAIHGVHAQNYHVFTPAVGKDWCISWNAASWTKEFPWANAVCRHDAPAGKPGKVVLEFWITPFDYAGPEGPQRAVESVLREGKIIGLGLIVIDYDKPIRGQRGFWNLSRHHTSYGDASELCAFRLMPIEPALLPALDARWSFQVVDHDRGVVAFKDESVGRVTAWKWTFGDGETSIEAHPVHTYKQPGNYVTTLEVTDADGRTSRLSRIWDVQLRQGPQLK